MELHYQSKKQLPSDKKLPQVEHKRQAKDKQQPMSP